MKLHIYCEGKAGSHDYDILQKLVVGLNGFEIKPIGSIRGAGAIIAFLESGISKAENRILFRDRDFDKELPSSESLEQDPLRSYCYYSYRNTIENYLFDCKVLADFSTEKSFSLIRNENEAKEHLINAAKKVESYQLIRHTMGKMRTEKTNFGTKWTEKSGILPHDLSEASCKRAALDHIGGAKVHADNWTEEIFQNHFDTFKKQIDNQFYDQLKFLHLFHGKDLASSFKQEVKGFPLESYYRYAKNKIDFQQFNDLNELRRLIESLTK